MKQKQVIMLMELPKLNILCLSIDLIELASRGRSDSSIYLFIYSFSIYWCYDGCLALEYPLVQSKNDVISKSSLAIVVMCISLVPNMDYSW